MRFCHKFKLFDPYIFPIQCRTPLKDESYGSNSLKYQRFTSTGCKDLFLKFQIVGDILDSGILQHYLGKINII